MKLLHTFRHVALPPTPPKKNNYTHKLLEKIKLLMLQEIFTGKQFRFFVLKFEETETKVGGGRRSFNQKLTGNRQMTTSDTHF